MLFTRLSCHGLLGLASLALASTDFAHGTDNTTANAACSELAREFPTKLYLPNTADFNEEATAIWSKTFLITPNCVFEPASAGDVSKALRIIAGARSPFAVRAGGHMPVRGAQSVQPGVMIALWSLNRRTLSRNKAIASIGPGQTWGDVYAWLAPYGLAVNGGRYSPVYVGGLLLAGGIGLWSSRFGWDADSVVGYEVVLPDGRIVEATASGPDKDLFWALKGGHNHFGIVTRFDMTTFAARPAFIRTVVWNLTDSPATTDAFFNALNTYTAPGDGIAFGTDPNPQAFRDFNAIEGREVLDNDGGKVYDSWTYLPFAAG
ncbi:hypothetical protein MFIFM68171_08433 [Madurella fahalii]|uniref:FAD-binding PCMH-type domain-containing protein n=1 Tax=Madurella fahalii TaxID=1157608 RepID=A0ABQ0GKC5_9PEZI